MNSNEKQDQDKLLADMLQEGDLIVEGLQKDFKNRSSENQELRISDVFDEAGNQYVNLVQEGGGVLGIALLGYTYVMERMGIRFLKLAGTSAGAINAALMAVVQPVKTTTLKSPIILYYLTHKDLFDFVDGNAIAKWLLKNTINYKNYIQCLLNSALFMLTSSLGLILFSSLLMWEGGSIRGLLQGSLVAYLISYGIFSQNRISDGIIGRFMTRSFFLSIFGIIILFIILAWGLSYIPKNSPCLYRVYLTFSFLGLLLLYSLYLSTKNSYSKFIQLVVVFIVGNILCFGIFKHFFIQYFDNLPTFLIDALPSKTTSPYQYLSVVGMSLFIYFFLLIGSISLFLYLRFNASKFGINPGEEFKKWISELMREGSVNTTVNISGKEIQINHSYNGIVTLRDLEEKLKNIPKLKYITPNNLKYQNSPNEKHPLLGLNSYDPIKDEPPLALITTEIVTENKIIFPKMWRLFYEDKDHTSPAEFVRASMSIPGFFEAFRKTNIPRRAERAKEWMQFLSYKGNEIKEAVFVDGGSISNFPINVFSSPRDSSPPLPTFGARLQDSESEDSRSAQTLVGIIGSIINTMRANYDKDFLITHPQYEDCITNIDVRDINWLNFNLPRDEQIDLFKRGAQAAADFLLRFDWELYKLKQYALTLGVLASDIRITTTVEDVENLIDKIKKDRGMEE